VTDGGGGEARRVRNDGLEGGGGWWAGGATARSRRPGLVTEAAGVVDRRGSRGRSKNVSMGLGGLIGRLLIYLPEGR
jgi:hypothetical protein